MAAVTDSIGHGSLLTFSTKVKQWMCFSCSVPLLLISAVKNTSTTATTWYLLSGNTYTWTPLATGSYSGTTATIWYTLAPGTYTLCNDRGWSSYNNRYGSPSPAYPQVKTNITIVSGWGNNTSQRLDIESITTERTANSNFFMFF